MRESGFLTVLALAGDKGKQEDPGKRGDLSKKVGAFSFIIFKSSPKIHPTDHTSIEEV